MPGVEDAGAKSKCLLQTARRKLSVSVLLRYVSVSQSAQVTL
jgi:hypothetical protein